MELSIFCLFTFYFGLLWVELPVFAFLFLTFEPFAKLNISPFQGWNPGSPLSRGDAPG